LEARVPRMLFVFQLFLLKNSSMCTRFIAPYTSWNG
jgi:hypothetical protein